MLKNFEPNKIFSITSKAPKYILLISIIILIFVFLCKIINYKIIVQNR